MPVTAKLTATCDNCDAVHNEIKVIIDDYSFDFPIVRCPPHPLHIRLAPEDTEDDADWILWPDGVTLCPACQARYQDAIKPQEDARDALILPLEEQMQRIREQIRTISGEAHLLPTVREWMACPPARAGE